MRRSGRAKFEDRLGEVLRRRGYDIPATVVLDAIREVIGAEAPDAGADGLPIPERRDMARAADLE